MKFICDIMLGKLARYLRIFGLDGIYLKDYKNLPDIVNKNSHYYFFTKRTKNAPKGSIFIKSDRIMDQLKEIMPVIKPYLKEKLFFTRCLNCNVPLMDIKKEDIEGHVPEYIYHNHFKFRTCPMCKKIYWAGSHIKHMEKWIDSFLNF